MRWLLPLVLSLALLTGCGGVNHPPDPRDHATDPAGSTPTREATREPTDPAQPTGPTGPTEPAEAAPLAFRGTFDVVEGVWFLGRDLLDFPDDPTKGQRNGLLGASSRTLVDVVGPALYGSYPVEVLGLDRRPAVPGWCEDVVEVSYEHGGGDLLMGGFEDDEVLGRLAEGSYRVRLCVEGLDRVVAETEEDEFQTYSSRHLFQIWPAPTAPDRVLRVGSAFAGQAHADVRR